MEKSNIVKAGINNDFGDILGQSALGFQSQVLNSIRDAVTNASLFYCASKQYGDEAFVNMAWSTYCEVRDLYENLMQKIVV